jgi:ABC-type multidrug transport system fused ATPase/permease subunit
MAFEELKENSEYIQEQVHNYIENNLEYYKLRSFKMAMKSTTAILKFSLISICIVMILLFFSLAVAFAIGNYLNSYPYGFLIVGGIYVFFTIILFFMRDKILEGPILEKFSEIFFND